MEDFCDNPCCYGGFEFYLSLEGFPVCSGCGTISKRNQYFDMAPVYDKPDPWAKPANLVQTKKSDWQSTRGRYKEKFHYNERVSQWLMRDPEIPSNDWDRIEAEALSGKYGKPGELTRASIILITRALKLQKFRERWKTILAKLNPNFQSEEPPEEFLQWAEVVFPNLVRTFYLHRNEMPRSSLRTKEGKVTSRQRHNFPSYNYTQRKLLEVKEIYDFHHEFPVPRSHDKLHALDDVFEKMCIYLNLPFQRSTVIKRPKLRRFK